jgi:glycosyltransferase involved in cell wall biosynthesis
MDLNRKDIVFYLLGNGGSFGEIVRKVERLKLKDFVKMPGVIRGKEFRTFLSTADVFMAPEPSNPLNDNSTFIKIAEYMAIGKPIVSYDLKETRATAGDSALYSMPGDYKAYANSILALLSDPVRSAQMGALGQQRVSMRFSWEHQQKILIAAYENALQR